MASQPPFDSEILQPKSGRSLRKACSPCDENEALTFIPDILYFGFVGTEQVSGWQPFTIRNTGDVQIGIAQFLIDNPEFEMQGSIPALLVPGETVTVSIRFRPTAEGARFGSGLVRTSLNDPLPYIRFIGIGGNLTGELVPATGQVESAVNTLILNRWAYRYGSFAISNIYSNEILLDYHVTQEHVLQPNFAGSKFSVSTPPDATWVAQVMKDDVQIGTIVVNTDGTIYPSTLGGMAIGVPVDSVISVVAPGLENLVIERLRMNFVGVINLD